MNHDSAAVSPSTAWARARVATVVVVLTTAACHPGMHKGDVLTGDGVKCGSQPSATAVYLDVGYDDSGTPTIDPTTCEIDSGTTVTWRGPEATPIAFQIRFKQASPVEDDPRGVLQATETDGRYRVTRQLTGRGTYPYGASANGRTLDPAIIIR